MVGWRLVLPLSVMKTYPDAWCVNEDLALLLYIWEETKSDGTLLNSWSTYLDTTHADKYAIIERTSKRFLKTSPYYQTSPHFINNFMIYIKPATLTHHDTYGLALHRRDFIIQLETTIWRLLSDILTQVPNLIPSPDMPNTAFVYTAPAGQT